MEPRLNPYKLSPKIYETMSALQAYVDSCGLERPLLELVKLRASQINGCAYCIDMHTKDARALGETEQRLYLLNAWRESPVYTERERAALEWTEAVTLVANTNVPDDVYGRATLQFKPNELANLTLATVLDLLGERARPGLDPAGLGELRRPGDVEAEDVHRRVGGGQAQGELLVLPVGRVGQVLDRDPVPAVGGLATLGGALDERPRKLREDVPVERDGPAG